MPAFKIATWNVNSVRVRLSHILAWLDSVKPDVLALQEIKVLDADFPLDAFKAVGYHAIVSGQKSYNGVAILSREQPQEKVVDFPEFIDPQRRILGVTIGDIRILNLYVPNGESLTSQKFEYKLNWLKGLNHFLKKELNSYQKFVVLGDFNIAPHEMDVHDPLKWENQVLFSQPERTAFQEILGHGLLDCFRNLNPNDQSYSWWDYRLNAFKRNIGVRIDHILASTSLLNQCDHCFIDKTPREWERPSDHAPVVAHFNI